MSTSGFKVAPAAGYTHRPEAGANLEALLGSVLPPWVHVLNDAEAFTVFSSQRPEWEWEWEFVRRGLSLVVERDHDVFRYTILPPDEEHRGYRSGVPSPAPNLTLEEAVEYILREVATWPDPTQENPP